MLARALILGFLFLLPVLAAQSFNLDGSVLQWVSAIVSVCLFSMVIILAPAKIANMALRKLTGLSMAILFALYLWSHLVSYYLQGSYFNEQFFFHMNLATLTESWRAYYQLLLIFIGWMGCIVWSAWTNGKNRAAPGVSGIVLSVLLVLAVAFDPGLRTAALEAAHAPTIAHDGDLDSIEWEALGINRAALEPSGNPATAGKNLLMMYLEGFDLLYLDETVFPNLTPNLQALNAQGWQLDNLSRMQGTSWTMAGLLASLCGTPLVHDRDVRGNNIMFTKFLTRAVCVPDVLHSAGYKQTFLGGASLVFGGKGVFFNQHSFDQVYGVRELQGRLADPSYVSGWGLYDDSLFDIAAQEFEQFSRTGTPFNLTLLTIDTHHPNGNPSRSCPGYAESDNSILQAVHCTDHLVGKFIEKLRDNAAFSETLIVIQADHLAMRNKAFSLFPKGYKRRLYFNVLNSGLEGSSNVTATSPDIAPTLLSLLGVKHDTVFLAGRDLTVAKEGSVHYRARSRERVNTLAFLNSNFLTPGNDTKRHSEFIDVEKISFKDSITDIVVAGNTATFRVNGKDPFLILPKFRNRTRGPMNLIITIDAPAQTPLSAYYTTPESPRYVSDKVRSESLKAGSNRIVLPLPAGADHRGIKVDPGSAKGEYTIHSIEIQM